MIAHAANNEGGVLFAVFQNGSKANGGVESVTQIIEGLGERPRVVLTNVESPITERWRRSAAEAIVWRLPYALGRSWRSGGLRTLARRFCSLVTTNWWTWRTLRQRRMTAVHCNDPAPFWHVVFGARLAKVPLILNLRDTKSREEGLDVSKYRRRFRWCARILVLSREMKTFYAQATSSRGTEQKPPIDYIYSVVDFERMRPLSASERLAVRRELGIPEGTCAIGFVATFNDKKNQLDYLRRAVPRLRQIYPAARTFFVGDFELETNPYAQACQEAMRVLGLEDSVHFAGYCSQVEKWYQACDLVVVPTRKEGMARCMIEALACGTPVISFDVASAREILEDHCCGRVVAQGDYEQMCQAVATVAQSPPTREAYAANGVAAARSLFSAQASLNKYRQFLLGLDSSNLKDKSASQLLSPLSI